jgi:hypothetical protein
LSRSSGITTNRNPKERIVIGFSDPGVRSHSALATRNIMLKAFPDHESYRHSFSGVVMISQYYIRCEELTRSGNSSRHQYDEADQVKNVTEFLRFLKQPAKYLDSPYSLPEKWRSNPDVPVSREKRIRFWEEDPPVFVVIPKK